MHSSTLKEPDLPQVKVTLRGLTSSVDVPVESHAIVTVASALYDIVTRKSKPKETFHPIQGVSIDLVPGTTTLVLGSAGSGKSTLLKAIAGFDTGKMTGSLKYNGFTKDELTAQGVALNRLVKYVGQEDAHLGLLTTRETLQFAERFQAVPTSDQVSLADNVIKMLQLENCKDTAVGSEFHRGVSGGEKKRVTLGEALVANARILALDEFTSGLDASTAADIAAALRKWAVDSGGAVITALQQPTPEVVSQFDNLVMLQDGHCVYSGPMDGALPFVETVVGIGCPSNRDPADFLIEYLALPQLTVANALQAAATAPTTTAGASASKRHSSASDAVDRDHVEVEEKKSSSDDLHAARVTSTTAAALTPEALALEFGRTPHANLPDPAKDATGVSLKTPFAQAQYGTKHHLSWGTQTWLAAKRQGLGYIRDAENLLGPWCMQAIMMGLLMGSVFFQLSKDSFNLRFSLFLYLVVVSFASNLSELPLISVAKPVFIRNTDSGALSPSALVFGSELVHLPLSFINAALMLTPAYFMAGLSPNIGSYLLYLAVGVLTDVSLASMFRVVTLVSPTVSIAEIATPALVVVSFMYSGVVIPRGQIKDWLLWIYYGFSPMSWTIRSWALIEAHSPSFEDEVNANGEPLGIAGLESFDFQTDEEWIYYGFLFHFTFMIVAQALSTLALKHVRWSNVTGTSRSHKDVSSKSKDVVAGLTNTVLPVVPLSMSWQNLKYTVTLPKKGGDKVLLHDVNGVARPGRILALTGASGAGKTTLLNVLSARTSTGKTEGSIRVAGRPRDDLDYRRLISYVQQEDAHLPTVTVREAMEFSARLRLDKSVTEEKRTALIDQLLVVLELDGVADWLVGSPESTGISPAQRKLLSIGVELVANNPVIFLDEPTTSLDSRSAMQVLRVLRKIADLRRTLICTVHAPSTVLFEQFDDVLLLQRGGKMVFNGPRTALVDHFESLGAVTKAPSKNPATWMVEVVAAANTFADQFPSSPAGVALVDSVSKAAAKHGAGAGNQTEGAMSPYLNDLSQSKYPGVLDQLAVVLGRTWTTYGRDLGYNLARVIIQLGIALFFGLNYLGDGGDQTNLAGVQATLSAEMLGNLFPAIIGLQTSAPHMFGLRANLYRETASRMYSSHLFVLSVMALEVVWIIITMLPASAIFYFMVGWDDAADSFFLHFAMVVVACVMSAANGVAWGGLVPNHQVLQIAVGGSQNFAFLFSSFFIGSADLADAYAFVQNILPYAHVMDVLSMIQFDGQDQLISLPDGSTTSVQAFVEGTYEFDTDNRPTAFGVLLAWFAFWMILAFVGFRYVRHTK